MKWGRVFFVKKVKNGGVFCKKVTFSQRRVHYIQYQYTVSLFYILLIWGGCVRTKRTPAYGPAIAFGGGTVFTVVNFVRFFVSRIAEKGMDGWVASRICKGKVCHTA